MAIETTLSIIKPDAVERHLIGELYRRIEQSGLTIVAAKMIHLTDGQIEAFYAEHVGKPFFEALKAFMSSGPVMVQVLQGEQAVDRYRELMGKTDPAQAACGTLRSDYAQSMSRNSVHGSDSLVSAAREIDFFFSSSEIFLR